ncbi:MAG: serine--tRNA ligase, partial [Anaerolineaceae bacterium]
ESKAIGQTKDAAERNARIEAMRAVGDRITELDAQVSRVEEDLKNLLAGIPNTPAPGTPLGKDDTENVVIRTVGEVPQYSFTPLPHWELGPQTGILDFERGVKVTGSRFYILNNAGARLQRALIAWALDLHIRQGYEERYLPFMVKGHTLFSAGQLPKFADNLYRDHEEDLWMVPTAEVPLTGMYMDEILNAEDLPLRYTAYTPCFRREKMSAGRDVRGIKRGHQFDKVEMYIYCKPEDGQREFDKMVADAEETCAQLGLTYRVKNLCTGDLGFNAHKTHDIEVWAPGCGEWLEVSSVSHVGEFQARRANIRYRAENGKTRHLHTLNGSGLGMPRTLIAVLENYQQADGSIVVPDVLKPWMGGIERIQAA